MDDPIETLLTQWRQTGESSGPGEPVDTTWKDIDLRPVVEGLMRGTLLRPEPNIGRRSDGAFLFYPGRVNGLFGESGDGKSWVAQLIAAQEIAESHHVAWLDFEDDEIGTVVRLLELGIDSEAIIEYFHYLKPIDVFDNEAQTWFQAFVAKHNVTLVVIDSTGESMAVDGTRPNDDDEVARWMRRLPRFIASLGPCVVLIDHLPKARDNTTLFAIGSQRKRAAITGSLFLIKATQELGKGNRGEVKLTTAKDRCGAFVRGKEAAVFILDATVSPYTISLNPPVLGTSIAGEFRPTVLMEKVSRYIEDHPSCTKSDVEKAVPGKTEYIRGALRLLVHEGFVNTVPKGRAILHTSIRPYREVDDLSPRESTEKALT